MIEPLKDNVIIEPIYDPIDSIAGIILPDRAQNAPKFGVVDSVGPDVEVLKPGDTVLLPGWDDIEMEIDGKKYIVLAEKAISVRISE